MKRLKYMGECLTELTQRGLIGAARGAAGGTLGGVIGAPGKQVSANVAGASGGVAGGVTGIPGSAVAGVNGSSADQSVLEAVRKFQWGLLRELPSLVLQPGEAVRSQVAG